MEAMQSLQGVPGWQGPHKVQMEEIGGIAAVMEGVLGAMVQEALVLHRQRLRVYTGVLTYVSLLLVQLVYLFSARLRFHDSATPWQVPWPEFAQHYLST
jgi:hypothetical protein